MKRPFLYLITAASLLCAQEIQPITTPSSTTSKGIELVALSTTQQEETPVLPVSKPAAEPVPATLTPLAKEVPSIAPLNEKQKNRGTLVISVPHDEVQVFINSHPISPSKDSRVIILNSLLPGLYEIKSTCDGKTNVEMVSIVKGQVTEVDLYRVHDRNYFCITPSWSTMISEGTYSVGPTIDIGWIYDDKIYFGMDWSIHPWLYDNNFVMGGMFKVMWYKPIAPFFSLSLGVNTGFIYHDYRTGEVDTSSGYYGSYYDYEYDENYYFGGGSTAIMLGRDILYFRGSYDFLVAEESDFGHFFKAGLMIKL